MNFMGAVRAAIADVNSDGRNELLLATSEGIEIRTQDNLREVKTLLPIGYCTWIEAVDLNSDGCLDLIAS